MIAQFELDHIKALMAKATPGAWQNILDDSGGPYTGWPSIWSDEADKSPVHRAGFVQEFWHDLSMSEAKANAALIAASHNIMPRLIEELEAARKEIARLREDKPKI